GLALADRRVLLIDLDPQGNATTGLGIDKNGLYPTVYHVLLGNEPVDKAIVPTALPHLRLLPSDIDLVGAELELVGMERREQRLHGSLDIGGIVLTMFDGRTSLALQIRDEVHRYFPGQIFETVIPRNVRLTEAPSYGKPVMLHDLRSNGAIAYLELARELIHH